MATVDPLFAQWLQAAANFAVVTDAAATARWGATAIATTRTTAIATKTDAEAEAARQLAFFARGPFAIDVHEFAATDWMETLGTVVTIGSDDLDYGAGVDVFVIEVEVDRTTGLSLVTVIRPLRPVS